MLLGFHPILLQFLEYAMTLLYVARVIEVGAPKVLRHKTTLELRTIDIIIDLAL